MMQRNCRIIGEAFSAVDVSAIFPSWLLAIKSCHEMYSKLTRRIFQSLLKIPFRIACLDPTPTRLSHSFHVTKMCDFHFFPSCIKLSAHKRARKKIPSHAGAAIERPIRKEEMCLIDTALNYFWGVWACKKHIRMWRNASALTVYL